MDRRERPSQTVRFPAIPNRPVLLPRFGIVGSCIICALFVSLAALVSATFPRITLGAGFDIKPQGGAATGKSGAFTAQADDPSALYYNPAGISQLSDSAFMVGTTVVIPSTKYTPSPNQAGTIAREEDQTFFLPHLYGSVPLGRNLTAGLGLFTPFGIATDWPVGWDGRFQVTYISVKATEVNPTLAWRPTKTIAVAAGIDIAYVTLKQRRQINLSRVGEDSGFGPIPGNPEGSVELEGEATAVGSSLGILISPTDRWQFGMSLRSRLHAEEENGRADFTIPVPAFQPFFPDGRVRTEVDLPPVLRAGVLARPLPQWNIELDAVWTGWSTIDRLVVEFDQGLPVATDTTEFLWEDSFTYNLGTEYRWADFAFRGGYTLDLSPIPDSTISPILPDGTRQWFSFGVGYGALPWKVDVAYTIILINRQKENLVGERYSSAGSPPVIPAIDARANGEYSTNTHVMGFSVSHYF